MTHFYIKPKQLLDLCESAISCANVKLEGMGDEQVVYFHDIYKHESMEMAFLKEDLREMKKLRNASVLAQDYGSEQVAVDVGDLTRLRRYHKQA